MDPLSQGVVGAVAAQQPTKRKHYIIATLLGFFSGLAPDLDILIKSQHDPLFSLEFHRQFTHSIFFIPIGGFICASFFYYLFLRNREISFKETYIYCTLGYLTHGFLDSCTSYGTQLFWPLSNHRVAWNTISIIDPIFTLPLFILIFFAMFKRKKIYSYYALIWILIYHSFGHIQKNRAENIALDLAHSRGHLPTEIIAKPSFGNIILWKTIYTTDSQYHVDAVKLLLNTKIIPGTKVNKLNIKKSFPWLNKNSQQAKDIERFRWFSNGYVSLSPKFPNRIIDVRYSMFPNDINALWGIELNPNSNHKDHVKRVFNRRNHIDVYLKLLNMISE
ncbi:MAG: metal-dependent hydrolase [Gammaproteobacteria bacterium]|nr:metal-dependent hydrolase [Gammaproteobacteria bacterium]|tara:strand:- start:184869 stop:185867 length:999 start_codon:yes stop_codon:yes gene_type:complete